MKKALEKYMIAGLLIVIPVGLTYFLLTFVVSGVDHAMAPVVANIIRQTHAPLPEDFQLPGLGFFLIFLFVFISGLLASNFVGRKVIRIWDRLAVRIPLVRTFYIGMKKLLQTLSETRQPTFEKMVFTDFPQNSSQALGIVCTETKGELKAVINRDDYCNVFVPSTPNVTTGFLLFMPRKEVEQMELLVEDGFKTLVSFGALQANKEESNESEGDDKP